MMAKLPDNAPPPILSVAIAVPLYRLFDYRAPENVEEKSLKPGIRVEVSFGKRIATGYVIEIRYDSEIAVDKLKTIDRIIDESALLTANDLKLIQWASDYYHHPIGEVVSNAFPAALRKGHPAELNESYFCYELTDSGFTLRADTLKRSPKQHQLMDRFRQQYPLGLTESGLATWDKRWRSTLTILLNKGLVRRKEAKREPITQRTELVLHSTESAGEKTAGVMPNCEQQSAIDSVIGHLDAFAVFLLEGVTGSGKTEVYMQIIRSVLVRGKQVLVLVPEINLTPQLEARFRQRFNVAMRLFHSNLTDKQRLDGWLSMQMGIGSILLGTRSALFTPLKNPGLIILDEEHDSSFKQQEGFRFSARDVAIMRGKLLNIPVVLGSATPSLETLHNANQNRYHTLRLTKRAGNAVEPSVVLLDIRNKKLTGGLSEELIDEMRKVLLKNEQVLLFLNRRGYAPTLMCHGCGWVARCNNCDANLVVHHHVKRLRCHHCGSERQLPANCPACKTGEFIALGLGTEQIESALRTIFPDKTIIRLDRDTTQRKGSLDRYLRQINENKAEIILGTQMLAKGHHFQNVTLVAIVDVDSGLFSIDYRASERLAQMIVQVSGRAGRAEKKGRVVLQTRYPDHPTLNVLLNDGYAHYAQAALAERKQALLPPFSYQALLRAHASHPGTVHNFLTRAAASAKTYRSDSLQVLGPVPSPMEKRASRFHYQLLLQSSNRIALQQCLQRLIHDLDTLKTSANLRWSLDVDPLDLY